MTRDRERERQSPLPPDEWVEVTTQFDDSDDARGRYLAARRRPYDAVENEIAPVRPAFPSSPGEAFTEYLDRQLTQLTRARRPVLDPGPRRGDLGLTLPEAWARLQAEYPRLAACVARCAVGPAPPRFRAAARELGVTHRTVGKWTIAGVAQLVVWSGLSEQQVTEELREARLCEVDVPEAGVPSV